MQFREYPEIDCPSEVAELVSAGIAHDMSYHNDACASVGVCFKSTGEVALRLWVEFEYPKDRENVDGPRFMVVTPASINAGLTIPYEGDDINEAVRVYRAEYAKLRASHEAARNSGSWPDNGPERIRCSAECAEMLDGDAE